jgi:hypothetical protein
VGGGGGGGGLFNEGFTVFSRFFIDISATLLRSVSYSSHF